MNRSKKTTPFSGQTSTGMKFGDPNPKETPRFVFGNPNKESGDADPEEFKNILDQKLLVHQKKERRASLISLGLFIAVVGGGTLWFVADPARGSALKTTLSEIRSAGDIKSIVAKYQQSLDKIAVRNHQINDATTLMGVNPADAAGSEDPAFNKEMREMAGPDGGPTAADRNAKLIQKFGSTLPTAPKTTAP